jgi:hypothetical protein
MSNRKEPLTGHGARDEASEALYVITLISSTMPLPLPVLSARELAGLAAFRSRRLEDGRERFRVHIGYFASVADAESLLPMIRESYPWAFVAPAPQANLSSLDDTAIARFSIVAPVEPDSAEAQSTVPPSPLSPRVSPPVLSMADAVLPAPAKTAAAPETKVMQRYAVQLIWSKDPIDLAKIPSLAIFGGYLLYAVETEPGGRRMFGVRLGFYDDALSARLVALYVRTAFKGVVVVPVSEREVKHASAATIRLTGARSVRGGASARAAWPRAAVAVAFAPAAASDAASAPF